MPFTVITRQMLQAAAGSDVCKRGRVVVMNDRVTKASSTRASYSGPRVARTANSAPFHDAAPHRRRFCLVPPHLIAIGSVQKSLGAKGRFAAHLKAVMIAADRRDHQDGIRLLGVECPRA
jgi:hypothetical protein